MSLPTNIDDQSKVCMSNQRLWYCFFFVSPLSARLWGVRATTGWLEIRTYSLSLIYNLWSTDKLYHIMYKYIEYTLPWTGFEPTTLVAIGTDCTSSCKCNYHTILIYDINRNQDVQLVIDLGYKQKSGRTACHWFMI
jgi:hypothetical protein